MNDICGDNRFEIIAKYKKALIDGTNIESHPEEMAVIDSILFRFWQMGWLKVADNGKDELRYCIKYINPRHPFNDDGSLNVRYYRTLKEETAIDVLVIILSCGCKLLKLYRGNVQQGELGEWKTPLIVSPYDDWVTDDWLNKLKEDIDEANRNKKQKLSSYERGRIDDIILALRTLGDEKLISYTEEIEFLLKIRNW